MAENRMEWFLALAGTTIRISSGTDGLFTDPGLLRPFLTGERVFQRELKCDIVDTLAPPQGTLVFTEPGRQVFAWEDAFISYIGTVANSLDGAYIRVERRGKISCAQFTRNQIRDRIPPKAVLTALEAEHLIACQDGILLHASCICHKEQAILFTAPSGTGKSTQAELWKSYRGAEIINGDRIVVRCTENGIHAVGIPFSGSSGICQNRELPLRAIVYLSQGKQNILTKLRGAHAFRRVWEGCSLHTWNREDTARAADTAAKVVSSVPVYHFSCTPDETAVQTLEAELTK